MNSEQLRAKLIGFAAVNKALREENDNLRRWHADMVTPAPEQQTILTHPRARFTPQERAMLGHLLKHAGLVVARDSLLAAAARTFQDPRDGPEVKIIDVNICKIRQKLNLLRRLGVEDVPVIETVWGVGYRARLPSTTNTEN